MENVMMLPPDDQFENLIEKFEVEYRREFAKTITENDVGDIAETRLYCRDRLLPGFPELEFCYKMHGIWHGHEWDEQPTAAQKGRRIAGIMFSVSNESLLNTPEEPKEIEPPEPTKDVIEGARWSTRSTFHKAVPKARSVRVGPTKTQILAESLHGLEPGYYVELNYDNNRDAKCDQALIDEAVVLLRWDNGHPANSRTYRSSVIPHLKGGEPCYLRVERLITPVPQRRFKHRPKTS